jgi:hypothetical protein
MISGTLSNKKKYRSAVSRGRHLAVSRPRAVDRAAHSVLTADHEMTIGRQHKLRVFVAESSATATTDSPAASNTLAN